MGRKSVLTAEQWTEVERRHLVCGDSINALANEFGINESSIRRKIKPNKAGCQNSANALQSLASEKVRVEAESRFIAERIAQLPAAKQLIVVDLARKLSSISEHLAGAAEFGAMTAHKLSGIANFKAAEIDDANPLDGQSIESLKDISALTRMANEASTIGINLLRANKETVDDLNKTANTRAPSGLEHFYGESEPADA